MSPALADGFFITRTTWVTHSTLYSLGQMTRKAKQKLWKKENLPLDPQIEISSHLNKMALIVTRKRNPLSCDVWLVTFTSQVSFISRLCCSSAPSHLPFSSLSLLSSPLTIFSFLSIFSFGCFIERVIPMVSDTSWGRKDNIEDGWTQNH